MNEQLPITIGSISFWQAAVQLVVVHIQLFVRAYFWHM